MQRQRESEMRLVTIGVLMTVALLGCGHDGNDMYGLVEPDLQAMQSRLQTHYTTTTDILGSNTQGIEALTKPDYKALQKEVGEYDEDMHNMMVDLVDTVTTAAGCSMMMGGGMMGGQGAASCPCSSSVALSEEELDEHIALMDDMMRGRDVEGMMGEMDQHLGQMGNDITQMGEAMRTMHGNGMMGRGGMMNMH